MPEGNVQSKKSKGSLSVLDIEQSPDILPHQAVLTA
jgi:hypothetical protein